MYSDKRYSSREILLPPMTKLSRYLTLSWLAQPGTVLQKHHVCQSKHDPLVSEVELIGANPPVCTGPKGRQSTVSLRDLSLARNVYERITTSEVHKLPVHRTSMTPLQLSLRHKRQVQSPYKTNLNIPTEYNPTLVFTTDRYYESGFTQYLRQIPNLQTPSSQTTEEKDSILGRDILARSQPN